MYSAGKIVGKEGCELLLIMHSSHVRICRDGGGRGGGYAFWESMMRVILLAHFEPARTELLALVVPGTCVSYFFCLRLSLFLVF